MFQITGENKMIILHGVYDNGKIKITEKKLPKIKAKVNIQIIEEQKKINKSKISLGTYNFKGIFDNKNIRDIAYEE